MDIDYDSPETDKAMQGPMLMGAAILVALCMAGVVLGSMGPASRRESIHRAAAEGFEDILQQVVREEVNQQAATGGSETVLQQVVREEVRRELDRRAARFVKVEEK